MPLRAYRLAAISAYRLLRSPRVHVLLVAGSLLLTAMMHIPGGPLLAAIYSSLVTSIAFYTIASRSRGFLEYISSILGCTKALILTTLGSGAAAAATAPLALLIISHGSIRPEDMFVALFYALLLGTAYSLSILPTGTTLPMMALLLLALKTSNPAVAAAVSAMLALPALIYTCRLGVASFSLRERLWSRTR